MWNKKRNIGLAAALFLSVSTVGHTSLAQVLDPIAVSSELSANSAGPVVTALSSQGALVFDPAAPIPSAFDLPSVDVAVSFDSNSHLLTSEGMTALRSIAFALQEQILANQTFQVASHLVLPNDPNSAVRLSTRRAQVVAEHLSVFYGIPSERLIPVGYGASNLRDPATPSSPLNTRIQFINILSD
ncbi:MAG: OmpA family protein [Roseobacter sp.]|jgi:outer membrane protein OmpA-like peptidoglycan-associated protein|nr:OmpA family protein [Roseobacter sp.]